MIGLAYLLFFVVYSLISFVLIRLSYRYAKRRFNRGWLGGFVAFIVMYNLIFWDWVPAIVGHKYLCQRDAGFFMYEKPDQWFQNNPSARGPSWGSGKLPFEVVNNHISISWISNDVYREIHSYPDYSIGVSRKEQRLLEANSGRVLAKSVEYYRGKKAVFV